MAWMKQSSWDDSDVDWAGRGAESVRTTRRCRWLLLAGVALVAILFGVLFWATAGFVTAGRRLPWQPCQYREAREGSGFETFEGLQIDDVRRSSSLRIAVVSDVERGKTPGTVLRMSKCDVPGDADVVAYVAIR